MQVSQAEYNGRATSFGEAVDVTYTEHNHPQDQASKEAGVLHKEGTLYSLSDHLHAIKYQTGL